MKRGLLPVALSLCALATFDGHAAQEMSNLRTVELNADASRAASPTTQADDAVVVDATYLGLAEVIDAVVALVRDRAGA